MHQKQPWWCRKIDKRADVLNGQDELGHHTCHMPTTSECPFRNQDFPEHRLQAINRKQESLLASDLQADIGTQPQAVIACQDDTVRR
ncbi:hypothetical protein, partial [Acinetobacter baumannii]|uniref:hypothetical protein n=1 Tax=Acinetobacter baumannii TaxID=470 RepID=UPI001F54C9E1